MSSDERVAALEAHRQNDQALLSDVSEKLDAVALDVQTIRVQLEGQKGFFKGVMFVLLPIWSAITAAAISLWDRWIDTGS